MSYDNRQHTISSFFTDYVNRLSNKAPNNSGDLARSISYDTNGEEIDISMLSYGKFLEQGINGTERNVGSIYSFKNKKPPISSLQSYAKSRGINVYALQNSIYKKGIIPQPFIEPTLDKEIDTFADQYIEAMWNELTNN